jgi:hypothetical protein
MEIQLPGNKTNTTDYKISRNASFDITLNGSVKTNVDYTIDLGNTETETEGEN